MQGRRPAADDVVFQSHLIQKRYDFYGSDTGALDYIINQGTVQSGSGTTVTLASTASSTDNAYNGYQFVTVGGTGSGQDRAYITAYNGSTKDATLSTALDTALDTTSTYRVINRRY